jgi:DNA-binding CsgD family transcriptional regulator
VRSWGLSSEEQDEVWVRWRQGESLRLIARRLGKRGPSVRAFVLQTGGVQHCPPRPAERCLSMAEREEISRGVAAGESCRKVAARLGRAPSTVLRELARNGGRGRYRAQAADAAAFCRAQRPKPAKLFLEPGLRAVVEAKLALRWSPEQIAGWLPLATLPIRCWGCRTRRSICRCSSRAGARCAGSCNATCARGGRCAIRGPSGCPRAVASSATPFPSASDPPRRPIGPCLAIGRRLGVRQATQRGGNLGRASQPLCAAVPTP